MAELDDLAWEAAEEISNFLHHIAGVEIALAQLLDDDMARRFDKGQSVFALLEAQGRFRLAAEATTQRLADEARTRLTG
jgi:hypothetical protein